jgi:hypothetical protein
LNLRPEDNVQPAPEPAAAVEDARVVKTAAARSQ